MNKMNEDRRRFFRITDAIGVSYSLVETDSDSGEASNKSAMNEVNVNKLLRSHNHAIKNALSVLKTTNAAAAEAITALDKKIDTVIRLMELDSTTEGVQSHSIHQASISACGIAFPVSEELSSDTQLNLTLYLETSGEQVNALGKVIDCQSLPEEGSYYLRVEFVEMDDSDREKLIQHIIQRQGSLLRSLKEQME